MSHYMVMTMFFVTYLVILVLHDSHAASCTRMSGHQSWRRWHSLTEVKMLIHRA